MGKYKKLLQNVRVMFIGNFLSKILSVLLIPIYTNYLSTDSYGCSDLITITISLLLPVLTLTIYEAVLRFSLDKANDKKQVFSAGFYLTILACIITTLTSVPILTFFNMEQYTIYFILYFSMVSFRTLLSYFLKGIEEVKVLTISGLSNTVTFIFFNILFLIFCKLELRGYLLSYILSNFLTIFYIVCATKIWNFVTTVKNIETRLMREMIQYSIPLIPNSFSWWISNSSDRYILTFYCGISMNGLYSTAYRIPTFVSMISDVFISAWQISVVESFGSMGDSSFFQKIYYYYSSILILSTTIIILFCKPISFLLFKNHFYDAWVYIPVLAIAVIFSGTSTFVGSVFTTTKRTKLLFVTTIIAALSNILGNLVLIPLYGAQGAAIATLLSYVINWLMRIRFSGKIMTTRFVSKEEVSCYILLFLLAYVYINNRCLIISVILVTLIFIIKRNFVSEVLYKIKVQLARG